MAASMTKQGPAAAVDIAAARDCAAVLTDMPFDISFEN